MFSPEKSSPDRGFLLRPLGDCLLILGSQSPSADAVHWLDREASAFVDTRPNRAVYFHVLLDTGGFSLPDDGARAAMKRFISKTGLRFAAAAVVVEQQGFAGAALRSVFSSVLLAVRPPTPTTICSSAAEARAFLDERVAGSVHLGGAALDAEISRLRAAFGAS